MTVTLRNDFHNSEARVRVAGLPATLTRSQVVRVRRKLCGISGCTCGGPLGERGKQDVNIDYVDPETIGLWAPEN